MTDITERLRQYGDGLPTGLMLMRNAADEIDRLRARVAELESGEALADTQRAIIEAAERRGYELGRKHEEAARGEPVAWMRRWHHDGETPKKSLNPDGRMAWSFKFKLLPVTTTKALPDDVPLYTAPPAPTVDVDAISEDAILRTQRAVWSECGRCVNAKLIRTVAGAIFNKGE